MPTRDMNLRNIFNMAKDKQAKKAAKIAFVFTFFFYIVGYIFTTQAEEAYRKQFSSTTYDRNGEIIEIRPSANGFYAQEISHTPEIFAKLLLQKEDRFFYLHPGVNPLSIFRDSLHYLLYRRLEGSSTITQQLAKNLLGNENERGIKNKIVESLYAIALELYIPKNEILTMYANTAYFGNQAKGLREASLYYFDTTPEALNKSETLMLLASLNSPSTRTPGTPSNEYFTKILAQKMNLAIEESALQPVSSYTRKTNTAFEINSLNVRCSQNCTLTIDKDLTEKLRDLLEDRLRSLAVEGVKNGAIVVIKTSSTSDSNELLALVGSPNPNISLDGQKINMATKPRPIGSTGKPFFYAKAFEKGARPYSLIDDREYKYTIGTGFEFYPKNYDGQYRGIVTLHEALANSLNVPSVKTLEFVGIDDFNDFLVSALAFRSIQPIETYQLGIALGGLEMDPLTLTNYYTIFPNEGILKPLRMVQEGADLYLTPPMADIDSSARHIIDVPYVRLINKILSDRNTSIDQFGIKSNLNLTQSNYAVKTGTSYDYHDSWTIGYTPDFLVGVWLGNSDNAPIKQVSGQTGAGKIWHDSMELLLASPYNLHSEFNFEGLREFASNKRVEYGLENDDFAFVETILMDRSLILKPHIGDVFLFEKNTIIPLEAREEVRWYANGLMVGTGKSWSWSPKLHGDYEITAETASGNKETVSLRLVLEEEKLLSE